MTEDGDAFGCGRGRKAGFDGLWHATGTWRLPAHKERRKTQNSTLVRPWLMMICPSCAVVKCARVRGTLQFFLEQSSRLRLQQRNFPPAKMTSKGKPIIHNMKELTYSNPVVFFDIAIGGTPQGRIKFELYADRVPKFVSSNATLTLGLRKTSDSFAQANSNPLVASRWVTRDRYFTAAFTVS
jgi:hypothetical protein